MPAMHWELIKVVKADLTFEAMQQTLSDVVQELLVNLPGRQKHETVLDPIVAPRT